MSTITIICKINGTLITKHYNILWSDLRYIREYFSIYTSSYGTTITCLSDCSELLTLPTDNFLAIINVNGVKYNYHFTKKDIRVIRERKWYQKIYLHSFEIPETRLFISREYLTDAQIENFLSKGIEYVINDYDRTMTKLGNAIADILSQKYNFNANSVNFSGLNDKILPLYHDEVNLSDILALLRAYWNITYTFTITTPYKISILWYNSLKTYGEFTIPDQNIQKISYIPVKEKHIDDALHKIENSPLKFDDWRTRVKHNIKNKAYYIYDIISPTPLDFSYLNKKAVVYGKNYGVAEIVMNEPHLYQLRLYEL